MKYIEIFGIIKTHSFENLGTFMQNFFEILGMATAGVHSNPDGRIYYSAVLTALTLQMPSSPFVGA